MVMIVGMKRMFSSGSALKTHHEMNGGNLLPMCLTQIIAMSLVEISVLNDWQVGVGASFIFFLNGINGVEE